VSAAPTGRETVVTALPWRALASTRRPQLEPLVVLALEMVSLLLVARRSLATMRRAAREASRVPLREVVQPALLVLPLSEQPLPQPPLS
jgi:hypothetical protein